MKKQPQPPPIKYINPGPPAPQPKPEVYFIRYKNRHHNNHHGHGHPPGHGISPSPVDPFLQNNELSGLPVAHPGGPQLQYQLSQHQHAHEALRDNPEDYSPQLPVQYETPGGHEHQALHHQHQPLHLQNPYQLQDQYYQDDSHLGDSSILSARRSSRIHGGRDIELDAGISGI